MQVLLQVFLCGRVNHGCLHVCNDTTQPGPQSATLSTQPCHTLALTGTAERMGPVPL